MRKYLGRADTFFQEHRQELSDQNWKILKIASILYSACLLVFYVLVCIPMNVAAQTRIVLAALAAQAVFFAVVWFRAREPDRPSAINRLLFLFSALVMAPVTISGTLVFRESSALLWPLMLLCAGQFFILPPRPYFLFIGLCSGVFLVLSGLFKPAAVFRLDLISTVVAGGIVLISYGTLLECRVRAAEARAKLRKMCSLDPLTGTLSKPAFEYEFDEFRRVHKKDVPYALAVIDLDNFRGINERFGHRMGDHVLVAFSMLLRGFLADLADSAMIGRYGGDEFVVLLRQVSSTASVENLFNKFIRQAAEHLSSQFSFAVTCCVGISMADRADLSFASIFLAADQSLFAARQRKDIGCRAVRIGSDAGKPLMLVADNHTANQELVRSCFENDFRVVEAQDGRETIQMIERYGGHLSIILLDLEMPLLGGRAVLAQLRQMPDMRGVPAIVFSDSKEEKQTVLQLGAADVLEKPLQAAALRESVKRALQ